MGIMFVSFSLALLIVAGLSWRHDVLYKDVYIPSDQKANPLGAILVLSLILFLIFLGIFAIVKAYIHYHSPEKEQKRILKRHPHRPL